jgi:membrane protein
MFIVLPNRHNSFRESLPGAVLASTGWLIFTQLFSFYVEHFSGYANVYGSVYAVALSMLWLYCCMSIVFCGGALNQILLEKK